MRRVIENSIQLPDEASEEAKAAEKRSQAMFVVRALTEEGIRVAKDKGFAPGSDEAWEVVGRAADIARDITFARSFTALPFSLEERAKLSEKEVRNIFRITHPAHDRDLIPDAKKGERMRLDRSGFEESVGTYLRNEFRAPSVERALLVALIDMEITEFLRYVHEADIFTKKSKASEVARTPFVRWLLGRFWAVVQLVVITACIVGAVSYDLISAETGMLLFFGAVILLVLGTVMTLFFYFQYRKAWATQRRGLVDLPFEMIGLYRELHSDGPLSVRRVRERVQQLADMGTVWPGAVWALLEDIEARKVTSLHN